MTITVTKSATRGQLTLPPAKALIHRILIIASLTPGVTTLELPSVCRDVAATLACLAALGVNITSTGARYTIEGGAFWTNAPLPAGESGATLRLLAPLVLQRFGGAEFIATPRLVKRIFAAGLPAGIEGQKTARGLRLSGAIAPQTFSLVKTSQWASGMLLTTLGRPLTLTYTGPAEYLQLTARLLAAAGLEIDMAPGAIAVRGAPKARNWALEPDFSTLALLVPLLTEGAVTVSPVPDFTQSLQPDRLIARLLPLYGVRMEKVPGGARFVRCPVTEGAFPDLSAAPDLAFALIFWEAAFGSSGQLVLPERLIYKETDRLAAAREILENVRTGAKNLDCRGDHRLAIGYLALTSHLSLPVVLSGVNAAEKSYPRLLADFTALGGKYE